MLRVAEPVITAEDRDAVAAAVGSGWVSGFSPVVEDFERAFSEFVGAGHGVAVPSGTVALHLALAALEVGPGDEVILPTFCMIAAYHAIAQTGATVVLCDSRPDTWNLDVESVREVITERTRAILPVHIYGLPGDMDELADLTASHGIRVVEDAAEAHGATHRGRGAGSIGDLGCFSFFANKIITCGEGGMVVTSDPDLAARLRSLQNLGREAGRLYEYERVGYGYRMPAASAALGLSQLGRVEELAARRVRNADLYRERLAHLPGLTFAPRLADRVGSDWMVGMLVDPAFGVDRDGLAAGLAAAGIETRPFFLPAHRQPFVRDDGHFPVADMLGDRGLLLPSGSNLTDADVERVSDVIEQVAHG